MSTRQQKKSGTSARSVKKVAKRARATAKQSPSRAKRFFKSAPMGVILGVAAMALVLAKLKHLV
jgi:3-oxoacyl-(acyl-carrier-protein) synthase